MGKEDDDGKGTFSFRLVQGWRRTHVFATGTYRGWYALTRGNNVFGPCPRFVERESDSLGSRIGQLQIWEQKTHRVVNALTAPRPLRQP